MTAAPTAPVGGSATPVHAAAMILTCMAAPHRLSRMIHANVFLREVERCSRGGECSGCPESCEGARILLTVSSAVAEEQIFAPCIARRRRWAVSISLPLLHLSLPPWPSCLPEGGWFPNHKAPPSRELDHVVSVHEDESSQILPFRVAAAVLPPAGRYLDPTVSPTLSSSLQPGLEVSCPPAQETFQCKHPKIQAKI